MAEANYFYKNTSIYFNEHISDNDLEEFAMHECIHYLQEVKDKKNYLVRMGLCDYTEFKIYGLGLNEAAVQLMASRINAMPKESVKYFGINFDTISPSCYPLECCLVNQLAYITGEDVLFESTIKSNDNFKKVFSELTSPNTFVAIQNAIDDIFNDEEEIIKLSNKIAQIDDRNRRVDGMIKKIDELKHEILLTFMRTQNLIISSYFDKAFNQIYDLDGIEKYRQRLYTFRDLLGFTEGYTFFNDYYVSKMEELDDKYNLIENGQFETSIKLVTKKEGVFIKILKTLKKIIFGSSTEQENID